MTTQSKPKLRLVLAIYTRELKTAFFLALSDERAVQIVATATNTAELRSYCRTFRPDVIVLEWELPGGPMFDLLPTLARTDPAAKILIISKPSSQPQIQEIDTTVEIFDDPAGLIDALEAFTRPETNQSNQSQR